jgi:hypothetical protein
MAVRLNQRAYEQAKKLVSEKQVVLDGRDAWSEHRPSADAENAYLEKHGFDQYGRWFLGIDEEEGDRTKSRYKFPYGDFEQVHRCGVLSAESRAGRYKHTSVELAAAHIHGMLDALM